MNSSEKPEILAHPGSCAPPFTNPPDEKIVHAFNWSHTCKKLQVAQIQVQSLLDGKMDDDYFKKLLDQNPYLDEAELKRIATVDEKFYKDSRLHRMILDFRKMRFPAEETEVLNPLYCATLDKEKDDKLAFYQGKGEIIDTNGKVHKYVVLGTKFSLRILSKAKRWFVDGTFKVVTRNYKQVYIWIARYDGYNIPCLYIILTSKAEALYNAAFCHVRNLMHIYGYEPDSPCAMLDYEIAARNSLKFAFSSITLKDDYFHFCKCLWTRAKKTRLCIDSLIEDTSLLIAFMKILIHISKDNRKEYFEDIKMCFTKKKKDFKEFIEYFENNWLETAFIDFKSANADEIADRTNNVCEGFNHMYNTHIGIKKASLAMFISKLKELELYHRQKVLKNIGKGIENLRVEEAFSEKLPFSQLYSILERRKEDLANAQYCLRSGKLEGEFINSLKKLSQDCYNYLFSSDGLVDEESIQNGIC